MNYFLTRIFNDKLKLAVSIILLFFPSVELLFYIKTYGCYCSSLNPNFSTFLSAKTVGNGHILQGVFLWFLPIYLLIISSEDVIEDFKTGNKNILLTRFGYKKYFLLNIKKAFTISFFLIFSALILNYLFVNIIFDSKNINFTYLDLNDFLKTSIDHPIITNLIFILVTSLLSGFIGTIGTSIALAFHNRQIIYPSVFLIWFAPCMFKWSLLFSMQPFTEYTPYHMLPAIVFFFCEGIIAISVSYIKGVKNAKI